MALVHSHLLGSIDSTVFEDQSRAMLGANSYVLFTVQKLVGKIVRIVQQIITVRLTACVRCI